MYWGQGCIIKQVEILWACQLMTDFLKKNPHGVTHKLFNCLRLRSESSIYFRQNQNKENEVCSGMKCISPAIRICSGKFK